MNDETKVCFVSWFFVTLGTHLHHIKTTDTDLSIKYYYKVKIGKKRQTDIQWILGWDMGIPITANN